MKKKLRWHMIKWDLSIIFAFLIVFVAIPLIIENIVINGIGGWKPFKTMFLSEHWLSFWGSYLGAIGTVFLGGFSLYQNKLYKDMSGIYQTKQDEIINDTNQKFIDIQKSIDKTIALINERDALRQKPYLNQLETIGNSIEKRITLVSDKLKNSTTLYMQNVGNVNILEIECYQIIINGIFYEVKHNQKISLSEGETFIITFPITDDYDLSSDIFVFCYRLRNIIGEYYLYNYRYSKKLGSKTLDNTLILSN